jgi:hypothetical protein
MGLERLDMLKKRYRFGGWCDANSLTRFLFVWKFFFSGDELPGWEKYRDTTLPGGAETPPCLRSIWRRKSASGGNSLLNIDVYECPSREAAHEILVELLGYHQAPDLQQQGPEVGDVAFGDGERWLTFARANLVVSVRNAGPVLVEVKPHAQRFDNRLTATPTGAKEVASPEIGRFEAMAETVKVDGAVPLRLETSDPRGRRVWYKFFSKTGEFRTQNGQILFQPKGSGPQDLTVYALNADRGVAKKTLKLGGG